MLVLGKELGEVCAGSVGNLSTSNVIAQKYLVVQLLVVRLPEVMMLLRRIRKTTSSQARRAEPAWL